MSLRPRVATAALPLNERTTDRLARVLETGLQVRPVVKFSTNNKRAAVSFLNLPDDVILKIAEAFVARNECSEIGNLCRSNNMMNTPA